MLNQKAIKKARGSVVLNLRSALEAKTNQIQALLNHIEELESEETPIVEQAEKFIGDGTKLWNSIALSDIDTRKTVIKMFDDAIAKITATKDAAGTIEILQLSLRDTDQYTSAVPLLPDSDSVIPFENIKGKSRGLYDSLKEAELNPRFIRKGMLDMCSLLVSW